MVKLRGRARGPGLLGVIKTIFSAHQLKCKMGGELLLRAYFLRKRFYDIADALRKVVAGHDFDMFVLPFNEFKVSFLPRIEILASS